MSSIKKYKDVDLLKRVSEIEGFTHYPVGYWIIAVRSQEDTYNKFDDKIYIFKGERFVSVMSGTTNTGGYGLKNFAKWNSKGAAIIKSDEWYYDVYQKGLHKGKMIALRQVGNMKYYRDGNGDNRVDETGEVTIGNNYTNFHCNDYSMKKGIKSWVIGGWSVGCVTINDITKYYDFMRLIGNEQVSLCLIKEF
jgi:hypothetical protein